MSDAYWFIVPLTNGNISLVSWWKYNWSNNYKSTHPERVQLRSLLSRSFDCVPAVNSSVDDTNTSWKINKVNEYYTLAINDKGSCNGPYLNYDQKYNYIGLNAESFSNVNSLWSIIPVKLPPAAPIPTQQQLLGTRFN